MAKKMNVSGAVAMFAAAADRSAGAAPTARELAALREAAHIAASAWNDYATDRTIDPGDADGIGGASWREARLDLLGDDDSAAARRRVEGLYPVFKRELIAEGARLGRARGRSKRSR